SDSRRRQDGPDELLRPFVPTVAFNGHAPGGANLPFDVFLRRAALSQAQHIDDRDAVDVVRTVADGDLRELGPVQRPVDLDEWNRPRYQSGRRYRAHVVVTGRRSFGRVE